MKKWYQLVFLLTLTTSLLHAQKNIDSLKSELNEAKDKDTLLAIYSKLIYEYSKSDPAKSIELSNDALNLIDSDSDNINFPDLFNSIGIGYYYNGNYLVSIEYFLKGLTGYEEKNDSTKIANALNNLGIAYSEVKNYKSAQSYYKRSLTIHKNLQNPNQVAAVLINIGTNYESLNMLDSAEYYYKHCLDTAQKYHFRDRLSDAFVNLGSIYEKKDQDQKALNFVEQALAIDLSRNYKSGLVVTYNLLGIIHMKLGHNENALKYLNKALQLSKDLDMINNQAEIYNSLSTYYEKNGNYRAAYKNHKNYSHLKDSIFTLESKRQIEDLQLSYENNKKEQEILLLSERNNLQETQLKLQKSKTRLLLLFTIFIIFVLGLLIIYNRTKIKSNRLLQEQYKKIRHQNEELEKRSRSLEDLSEEKDNFINVVAHDLKSPLNNISGLSNLIRMHGKLDEEHLHYLNLLDQVSTEAKNLVTNLLDINKLESGSFEQNVESFSVNELIDYEIQNFHEAAQEKKIEIKNRSENGLTFSNNKEFIQRILNNLLSNAIKFSTENKKIIISGKLEKNQLQLSVKDEGPGINKEEQKQLFKKFQRLSTRPTAGESSTGLGLAIVKLLIEKLKGQVKVESDIGKGTEFIVIVPAYVENHKDDRIASQSGKESQ